PPWLIRGWKMLGNALGALVALLGLFGVSAVVCAIVWTLCAWSGRWYDWLLSFVTPLGLASITTCLGCLLGGGYVCRPVTGRSCGRLDRPAALRITFIRPCVASCVCH